jgi:hypothetical protein
MDLERMLVMCQRDQWQIDDLDWTVTPRPMSPEDEMAVVQYFHDMSGIELLAKELFEVQRDRAEDPTLRAIFETFIVDEQRHSEVARRLAHHYDVHGYRTYAMSPHLMSFREPFVRAVHHLSPDIANAYITSGELLLDVALLRSLDDFVDDAMSKQAMHLINRDESRHIAVDFRMVEFYASDAYDAWLAEQPARTPRQRAAAAVAIGRLLYHAGPFIRDVFFGPMDLVDPKGTRLIEAFKRIQLIGTRPGVSDRPFQRFLRSLQDAFNDPRIGPLFGPLLARIIGLEPRVIRTLYTDEELARSHAMSFDELAADAVAAKYQA